MSRGTGPGVITPDGCAVELYAQLPAMGEPEIVHAAIPAGASVLELGCGSGRVSTPLAELGHRVLGVDESAEMLALCRNIETVRAEIGQLRLDEQFDAVLLPSHLINTPDEKQRAGLLDTCRRHVAPDGVVVIQRHSPGWLREASDSEHENGRMRTTLTVVDRPGPDLLHAIVSYQLDDSVWEQEFTAKEVDDEALPDILAASGLRLDRTLTENGAWFTARPVE
jgi:SAM-dependent methyltransferase